MKAYLSDEIMGEFGIGPTLGAHDPLDGGVTLPRNASIMDIFEHEAEVNHLHWSILTIDGDGVVTDVDWGYHSQEEAVDAAIPAPPQETSAEAAERLALSEVDPSNPGG